MKLFLATLLTTITLFASIDINHANIKELTSLKGIGTKKAEAIVAYRKGHCFKNVKEIVKVKGIGQKFLEKNSKNLKITTCKKRK